MAEQPRGMGRGLAAILSPTIPADGTGPGTELRDLPVDLIHPNPRQPRKTLDEEALLALAESLRHSGVLQPVLVRPRPGGTYELIAGERRWRAAQAAELEAIPALVRPHDDAASLELALVENMVREDLNPVEEARACSLLVDELGLTREQVGKRVGRSRVAVTNLMRLLDLPDEVLELISLGRLTEGHGRALLTVGDHDARRRLADQAADEGWSVRETEIQARELEREEPLRRSSRRGTVHPDQLEVATQLEASLGRILGAQVRVAPRGEGYRITMSLLGPEDVTAFATRLSEFGVE